MNDATEFDVVVLGGGIAGMSAADYVAEEGRRVCLVANDILPFNLFFNEALSALSSEPITFEIIRQSATDKWTERLRILKDKGATIERGQGTLVNKTLAVVDTQEGQKLVKAKAVVIATGSVGKPNPAIPFNGQKIISSDNISRLDTIPEKVLVVSGGKTGCEIAAYLKTMGKKVFLCDEQARLFPDRDPEISMFLEEGMKRGKVKLLFNRNIQSIFMNEEKIDVTLNGGVKFSVDMIVFTGERLGNSAGLGLDGLGVRLGGNKEIWVNDIMETSVPGIYAAGGVTGRGHSGAMSEEEGRVAAGNALGNPAAFNPDHIPLIIHAMQEVACVGCHAEAAHFKGFRGVEGRSENSFDNEAGSVGFFKVVADKNTNKIIGAQVVGKNISTGISQAAKAIKKDFSIIKLVKILAKQENASPGFAQAADACLVALKQVK